MDLTPSAGQPEYIATLRELVAANAEKRKATREESAAKKTIGKQMAEAGKDMIRGEVDGRTYEVTNRESEADVVDVDKLFKLVDLPTFLSMVTVSQSAVKEACGSNVLSACLRTEKRPASIKLTEIKD